MKISWYLKTDQNTYQGEVEAQEKTEIAVNLSHETIASCVCRVNFPLQTGEKIFVNGFQSWTYCPEHDPHDLDRSMQGVPSFVIRKYGLDKSGDEAFTHYGHKRGIFTGYSWAYFRLNNIYHLFGSLDEDPGYTRFIYDANKQVLTMERDVSGVTMDGRYHVLDLFQASGSEKEVFDGWFKELGITSRAAAKLYGYSSWYNRYQDINADAIQDDLAGCNTILKQGDLFQIDDGWEPYVGDWLEADQNKFPGGMKDQADRIHKDGYLAGLWLAPYVAETKSCLYQNHPDWFLQEDGHLLSAGSNWSGYYALDFDNQEVRAYLKQVFDRIFNEWGFDLVKLDFLFAAAMKPTANETRAARMHRAMIYLRSLCKDHLILGCGVPLFPAFGLVDYCRIGPDMSLSWDDVWYMKPLHKERISSAHTIINTVVRHGIDGRAWRNDPDVFLLRKDNIKMNEKQKMDLARINAIYGGVFLTSDNPSSYTPEMQQQYQHLRQLSEAKIISLATGKDEITANLLVDGSPTVMNVSLKGR